MAARAAHFFLARESSWNKGRLWLYTGVCCATVHAVASIVDRLVSHAAWTRMYEPARIIVAECTPGARSEPPSNSWRETWIDTLAERRLWTL
jgi:hypothetical protein